MERKNSVSVCYMDIPQYVDIYNIVDMISRSEG